MQLDASFDTRASDLREQEARCCLSKLSYLLGSGIRRDSIIEPNNRYPATLPVFVLSAVQECACDPVLYEQSARRRMSFVRLDVAVRKYPSIGGVYRT